MHVIIGSFIGDENQSPQCDSDLDICTFLQTNNAFLNQKYVSYQTG